MAKIYSKIDLSKYADFFVEFYGEKYRKQIENTIHNIYIINLEDYRENDNQINAIRLSNRLKSLNIEGNIDRYQETILEQNRIKTPVSLPFLTNMERRNTLGHIIILPLDEKITDHLLIHEINHALCAKIITIDNEGFSYTTGIDELYINTTREVSEEAKRKITNCDRHKSMLNEILNDYLSIKILNLMKTNNSLFFIEEKEGDYLYPVAFDTMKEFLEEFLDDIAKLSISKNLSNLKELIGDDCYVELIKCTNEFMDQYESSFNKISKSIASKLNIDKEMKPIDIVDNINSLQLLALSNDEQKLVNSIMNLYIICQYIVKHTSTDEFNT